jgi:hypothetical protein
MREAFCALIAAVLLLPSGYATAGFADDNTAFSLAISMLRGAVGQHARALRIEADVNGVEIEAQDARNHNHINRWRYGTVIYMGIPVRRLTGPEPVDPAVINPDIEANLFDLDSIDFTAAPKLVTDAIARAHLQDPATVMGMEIARQTFILPQPSSGDVRWTVHVDSGRERAEIFANAEGLIVGADVSGTQRAKTLNILKEPELAAEAAAAFRDALGPDRVLTRVGIDKKTVSFGTNIPDKSRIVTSSMPVTQTFTWDLNGLQRRLGSINVPAQTGTPSPPSFGIGDVEWRILSKLEDSAIAKAEAPKPLVTHVGVAAATDQPGQPVLLWTIEVTDAEGETTQVMADMKGAITRVVLPQSRRPKVDWRQPAALAGAIARISSIFGQNAKIASIVANDREARVTIEDPTHGGQPATFEFSADGVSRATISFSLEAMGPRFGVGELAPLNEQKLAALEADALKTLGANRQAYLESVTIGAHPFVRQAGAHAIEVRVRDIPEDSARANYAWIVYDFNGRALDSSKF